MVPENVHTSPTEGIGNTYRWISKAENFKEMYEALLQLPEGWADLRKNPFHGEGMNNFWNHTMLINEVRKKL